MGNKIDLSEFECCMCVGGRQAGLSIQNLLLGFFYLFIFFNTTISKVYGGQKERKIRKRQQFAQPH